MAKVKVEWLEGDTFLPGIAGVVKGTEFFIDEELLPTLEGKIKLVKEETSVEVVEKI